MKHATHRPLRLPAFAAALAAMLLAVPVSAAQTPTATKFEEAPAPAEAEHLPAPAANALRAPAGGLLPTALGNSLVEEFEPNNTAAEATPLSGTAVRLRGNIFPVGDLDYFRFDGNAGDRVYAATMTSFAAGSNDSVLTLFDADGTSVLETDDNDGSFAPLSSSIAGAVLPASGTYFLQVRHVTGLNSIRPYDLYFQLRSGSPTAETEPNDIGGGGQALPPSGWATGIISPAGDNDAYTVALDAGDTVFVSLDLDPERDLTTWNGRLAFGVLGSPPQLLAANDPGVTSPNSEAFFFTVKDAGSYVLYVDEATSAGNPGQTYHLSASVFPASPASVSCATYSSGDVPANLPDGPGLVTSTLTVPGNPRIADLDISIALTHANMPDLDVVLQAPGGNQVVLFSDVGGSTQQGMDLRLDDEAALPIGNFLVNAGVAYQPRSVTRLSWFDGQDGGGTWTLQVNDDTAANGGTLTGWSLTLCEAPPPPSCPLGTRQVTAFGTDFETSDGGFAASGTAVEWAWGTPSFAPIDTCASGSNCWVTDLANTYNASSNQTLVSPVIDLGGLLAPVTLHWAQKHQIESASFDNASVRVQQAGGANATTVWEWLDATMTQQIGNPVVTVQQSAGWALRHADISAYAGQSIEATFQLSSDSTVQLAGLAIDDVLVTGCELIPPPQIDVSPAFLLAEQLPNTASSQSLTVANLGEADLIWQVAGAVTRQPARPVVLPAPRAVDPALASERVDAVQATTSAPASGARAPASAPAPQGVVPPLFDNGPFVTHPGGGGGGFDASALETALGLNVLGFGHSTASGFRVADDFTVPASGWWIDQVELFAYQTNSGTDSTITAVNLRIWDGPPGEPGSAVVFGDDLTNRLTSSQWTGVYRATDADLTNTQRPIMRNRVDVGVFLPAGVYWLDWQTDGSLVSGPWAPPISILGQATTGDARQFDPALPGWIPLLDTALATGQGLPFLLYGLDDCALPSALGWLGVSPGAGTLGGGLSEELTVGFDSTGLSPGTYDAKLCVLSNDPDSGPGAGTNLVEVPVSLTVTATPSIEVGVTVGTEAGTCAATSSLAVDAGTTVYFCYTVTNTGDVTLNLHDLADDQLGTIFTGLNYALTPGSSVDTVAAGLSIPVEINGSVVHSATWTAYNAGPSNVATAMGSASVTLAQPSITLAKTVGTEAGVCATSTAIAVPPGSEVTYCYTVTNTGNVTLNVHDLDDDQLGTLLSGFNFALTPGASAFWLETTTVGDSVVNTAIWDAYNPGPVNVTSAEDSATVIVSGLIFADGFEDP